MRSALTFENLFFINFKIYGIDLQPTTLNKTIIKNFFTKYANIIAIFLAVSLLTFIYYSNNPVFELLGVIGIIYIVIDYLLKCIIQ